MHGLQARRAKDILLPLTLVVAALYLAREFFVPLALAILLAFVLAPIVRKFEQWHFGRVGSVVTVTFLTFGLIVGIGAIVGGQLIDLANTLPKYQNNLHEKILAIKVPKNSGFSRAADTLKDLSKEFDSTAAVTEATTPPAPTANPEPKAPSAPALATAKNTPDAPVYVSVVSTSRNSFETLMHLIRPILAPLGTAALVIVFVVFMLLGREDLRDRLIHLIGRGHLQTTTQAMDDAAGRVSRYLLAQLMVNASYGVPIGIGLYFIGIPNAVLWGLLATVLRFIPYLGPWIAAAFPIALSLAVAPGWSMPTMTLALFVVVELLSNNVLEPWLYGQSTGISPMAVIIAAAFWTWLWGVIGLLLATPLTVCLAVVGKYLPALSFFDVLLGDKPPIAPEDRFYQRLLAQDEEEVCEIAETYLAKHSLAETYDRLVIPAIRLADEDYHREVLPEQRRDLLLKQVNDLVSDLGDASETDTAEDDDSAEDAPAVKAAASSSVSEAAPTAVVIPACDFADELTGLMLTKVLANSGAGSKLMPSNLLASETLEEITKLDVRQFCISVTPPGATRHAIYLAKRLRDNFPEARIIVGLWGEPEGEEKRINRFRRLAIDGVFISIQEVAKQLLATATVVAAEPVAAPAAAAPNPAIAEV